MIDLEKLFENFLSAAVKNFPDKYKSPQDLEEDMPRLYEKWLKAPAKSLGGLSPVAYVDELDKKGLIFDYITEVLSSGGEVSDIVTEKMLQNPDAATELPSMCRSGNEELILYAAENLQKTENKEADEVFLEAAADAEANATLRRYAYEYLSGQNGRLTDRLLELAESSEGDAKDFLMEILACGKGDKRVYYALVTMLYRAENVPLYADLLAKYDDPAAIEVLKSFADENPEINYQEFLELRYAVERLGGEWTAEKDFSEDPLYKFQHEDEKTGRENPLDELEKAIKAENAYKSDDSSDGYVS